MILLRLNQYIFFQLFLWALFSCDQNNKRTNDGTAFRGSTENNEPNLEPSVTPSQEDATPSNPTPEPVDDCTTDSIAESAPLISAPLVLSPSSPQTAFFSGHNLDYQWSAGSYGAVIHHVLVKAMLPTGQPVIDEFYKGDECLDPALKNQFQGSYSPKNLSPGLYRWWVRGINLNGEPGPWSQPLDFEVR